MNYCFDLDGTLLKGDCLIFGIKNFLFKQKGAFLFKIIKIIAWYFKSVPILKFNIYNNSQINIQNLYFYQNILNYMYDLQKNGNKVYIASGSYEKIVEEIAIFLKADGFFATSIDNNLVGINKANKLIEVFGKKNFLYIGNEYKDRLIWQFCTKAIGVNVNKKTKNWIVNNCKDYELYFAR